MEDTNKKPVRLTKSGKPDRRSISSRQNIQKARSKVKNLVKKAKKAEAYNHYIDEESEEDDFGYEIKPITKNAPPPEPITKNAPPPPEPPTPPPQQEPRPEITITTLKPTPPPTPPPDDRYERLYKEVAELRQGLTLQQERNRTLTQVVQRQNNYKALNSLSQRMMMKF